MEEALAVSPESSYNDFILSLAVPQKHSFSLRMFTRGCFLTHAQQSLEFHFTQALHTCDISFFARMHAHTRSIHSGIAFCRTQICSVLASFFYNTLYMYMYKLAQQCFVCTPLGIHLEPIKKVLMTI